MKTTTEFQLRNPPHVGEFVREDILAPLRLTVTDAAKALGVGRVALSTFLHGHASLSTAMAIRLDKAFGVSMETLLRMQLAWDLARAREGAKAIGIKRYRGTAA